MRRYDAEGQLVAVDDGNDDRDGHTLPPLVARPYHGRESTRAREQNAERHSQNRAQWRRHEETVSLEGEDRPNPPSRTRLASGFRTDHQAAKRRTEVEHAREAMTWDALHRHDDRGWQPAVSSNFRHAGDLHNAELEPASPKAVLDHTSKRKKKGTSATKKARGKRSRKGRSEVGEQNTTQPWQQFRLPDLEQSPMALQPWAAQLAVEGWQGTGVDADFSPWGELPMGPD